jgi:hypothetical protein
MEMIGCEVTASSFKYTLGREWLVDWVVREDLLEALCNDILNTGVEPLEKGRVKVGNSDSMTREKGGSNSQKVSVVFQHLSFTANARLS